jgi:hypothetical protein
MRLVLIVAVLAVVFWIYSVIDGAVQPADRHRGVSKPVWILILLLLPVTGGVLWFTIGRSRLRSAGRPAPDDDPAFLGSLADLSDQDERIRRLEEELARLDAEDVDPDLPPRATDDDEKRKG